MKVRYTDTWTSYQKEYDTARHHFITSSTGSRQNNAQIWAGNGPPGGREMLPGQIADRKATKEVQRDMDDRQQKHLAEIAERRSKRHRAIIGWLDRITEVMEIAVAIIVLAGFIINVIPLVRDMPGLLDNSNTYTFHVFLEHAFNLVIGIEFIRMLVRHTPGSALEVLMFAIARHMVLDSGGGLELILSVGAIGGLFAIRKFLFVKSFTAEEPEELHVPGKGRKGGRIDVSGESGAAQPVADKTLASGDAPEPPGNEEIQGIQK